MTNKNKYAIIYVYIKAIGLYLVYFIERIDLTMKLKKFLTPLMAAVVTTAAVPVANVTAASPKVYVDITYENNERIRADIMFENIDDCCGGNFHVEVGDGWNLVYDNKDEIEFLKSGCKSEGDIVVLEPR